MTDDFLVRKTWRKIIQLDGYDGICHNCSSPIRTKEKIIAIEIENATEKWVAIPIDVFQCPYCSKPLSQLIVYKSLNVTQELNNV